MIDLRYYNGNIEEYMKEHKITDVLVLYNITNLFQTGICINWSEEFKMEKR